MGRLRDQLGESIGLEENGRLVWLGNFEVERFWRTEGLLSLPLLSTHSAGSESLINSLSELALWLADPHDLVLLHRRPDPDFIQYMKQLGWSVPQFITIDGVPSLPLTDSLLADEQVCAQIRQWATQQRTTEGQASVSLMPHGASPSEERLAHRSDLRLAAPESEVVQKVNSKIYSRRICAELGIRQPQGSIAHTLTELEQAAHELRSLWKSGSLVVKDAMGVSGKGIIVLEDEQRFEQIMRLLRRSAERDGHERIEFVIEQWLPKQCDLNATFTIDVHGNKRWGTLLRALVQEGVHQGHQYPHGISAEMEAVMRDTGERIGSRLAADSYFGPVGIDAMISKEGTIYPCLEINARLNMSSYHVGLLDKLLSERADYALISQIHFRRERTFSFAELQQALEPILYTLERRLGIVVCAFAPACADSVRTMDAGEAQKDSKYAYPGEGKRKVDQQGQGRLYIMSIGSSTEQCSSYIQRCKELLEEIPGIQCRN